MTGRDRERAARGWPSARTHDDNGLLYTCSTNRAGQRQLAEYRVAADDPDVVDPSSERVLVALDRPEGSVDFRH